MISTPTRVTDRSSTLIDHLYTNKPERIIEIAVPSLALSDHYPICFTRKIHISDKKIVHTEIQYRDFRNFDENVFLTDLNSVNFDSLINTDTLNEALQLFYDLFFGILNQHSKVKSKRVKLQHKPKWISPEINEARYKRDSFHKLKDMDSFKVWRNKVRSLIRNAKRKYYSDAIAQIKNTTDIWKYMKELNPKTGTNMPNVLMSENEKVETPEDIANMFNSYFTSVSFKNESFQRTSKITLNNLQTFMNTKLPIDTYFQLKCIHEHEVYRLLSKLDINKSAGVDTFGPNLLKIAAHEICKPVAYLINRSIIEGTFPDKLKIAKVTPIFKKGKKSDPGNYRPISILPTLSKIYEKHVASQIYEFLVNFELLHIGQSGFRKQHSCQTALTKMTELWLKEMDKGNLTGILFLDFSKAFDLVNHNTLLEKLKLYKFDNRSILWIKSYLEKRIQRVQIGSISSKCLPILSGVPQGSVLGPLLFLMYVNDLSLHVTLSSLDLFADDATLQKSSPYLYTIERDISTDVKNIQRWCNENSMVINVSKTKSMLLATNQKLTKLPAKSLNISMNSIPVDCVKNHKLLGINIDNNLSYVKHVDSVCHSITSKTALLRRIKPYLSIQYRKMYYNAYILPVIDYCLTIWGNAPKVQLNRILKLQKSAARIILDKPYDSPSKPLFEELEWLDVYERLEYNKSILIYKAMNGQTPGYITDMFSSQSTNTYHLRSVSNNNLSCPKPSTELLKKSLHFSGVHIWNAIPSNIRFLSNLTKFKCAILKHIVSKRHLL